MAQAQGLGVAEQLVVGIGVLAVEQTVADRQGGIVDQAVPFRRKGRAVAEFADPAIGGGGRAQARVPRPLENGRRGAEAGVVIAQDAALDRTQAAKQGGIKRAGQRGQFGVQLRVAGLLRFGEGAQIAHAAPGRGRAQAVQKHKN